MNSLSGDSMKAIWRKATFFLALLLVSIGIVSLASAEELPLPLNSQAGHPVLSAMLEASRIGRFYRIQPGASEVGFHVDSKFQNVQGKFRQFKGGIALEPGSGDNGQAVFIVKSDSVSTSNSVVDRVIKSDMFFDADAYPDIRFVSSGFSWRSKTRGFLKGRLTLHGVTRAIVLDVELSDIDGNRIASSETILIRISASISRSDFNMRSLPAVVGDTIRLGMTIQAKKQSDISKQQLVSIISD